jgi:hypothetical protein
MKMSKIDAFENWWQDEGRKYKGHSLLLRKKICREAYQAGRGVLNKSMTERRARELKAALDAVRAARKALRVARTEHETALLKWHAAMNADLISSLATP